MKFLVQFLILVLLLGFVITQEDGGDPCGVCSGEEECENGCHSWRDGCEGMCQGGEGGRCEGCRAGLATQLQILRKKMGLIPPPRIIPGLFVFVVDWFPQYPKGSHITNLNLAGLYWGPP